MKKTSYRNKMLVKTLAGVLWLFLILGTCFQPMAVKADVLTVTGNADSEDIQGVIDVALPGDTIEIEPGTYVCTSDLIIPKDITLVATDSNPDNTTLILGKYRILIKGHGVRSDDNPSGRIKDVTIEGVTITGHDGSSKRGPIQNFAKNLTLMNCKIVENKGVRVSAIYNSRRSKLNLENTLIARNTNIKGEEIPDDRFRPKDKSHCGTIYLGICAKVYLKNSTIADNINEADPPAESAGDGEKVNYGAILRSCFD